MAPSEESKDAGSAPVEDTGVDASTEPAAHGDETESKAAATGSPRAVTWMRGATGTWPRRSVGLLVVLLIAAVVVLAVLLRQESSQVAQMNSESSEKNRAQEVALSYATEAATMNYSDIDAWKKNLTKGTTPELTKKLSDASTSMEQIIVPLQWSSEAEGLGAVVKSAKDGQYVVVAFVSVDTKNAQAPDGVKSTATYTVTLDRDSDWVITDVGGVETAVGG
ncbi:hypothetical protein IA539_20240 [Gordonia sp. zg691]|uniref:Mce-associated membrane protein n=1 Tax=Gordonia jinghuaiqii TaxID=2758710 RepID=A0A7D7LUN5_9ACTN|nr:hypothetical protein [Gordonia jinghuaiqii]MBD0863509.1 hypothetical protein [Gordonia jinghuaiqii]MCR5979245.1 hypothetical protein [Gordonia jinghuaiqii]QMT01035.1 hypothetical protein H1R19_19565 [Gordonia jinghuaiqii]